MSVTGTFTTNPSPAVAKAQMDGMDKHNLAHQLEQRGNLAGVAQMFLEALHVKERGSGPNHLSMGISYNSLGEVYAQIEKLDDAEEQFRKALEIRRRTGPAFDTAVTRENLAQLFERRGEYSAAREIRVDDEDHIACSNYHCPNQKTFTIEQLKGCARCHSPLYCSKACQTVDWKTRHKKCCKKEKQIE